MLARVEPLLLSESIGAGVRGLSGIRDPCLGERCQSLGGASYLFQRGGPCCDVVLAFLGWIFLASMSFESHEAVGLFVLWIIQFAVPSLRHEMVWVYAAWIAVEVALVGIGKKKFRAFGAFARAWKGRR